ncbi:MAG: heavy metal-associated domain-containing protein [Methylococcaceae bacterium]
MTESVIFTVTGMKCGGCENNVIEKLTALDGVISAVANCKENHVSVEFDAEKIEIEDLEDVIIAAGFGVE